MESAVTVCITIAKKIYAMAQMAKNNKAQSLLLGERVNFNSPLGLYNWNTKNESRHTHVHTHTHVPTHPIVP